MSCCTVPVLVEGYWNAQTQELDSAIFNCIRVTITDTFDPRRRALGGNPGSGTVFAFDDGPGTITGLIPWGTNPSTTNYQTGTAGGYDIGSGSAMEFDDFGGFFPEGFRPIGAILGDTMSELNTVGYSRWVREEYSKCCGGQKCVDEFTGDPVNSLWCVTSACTCDDPKHIDCDDPFGYHGTYYNYVKRGSPIVPTGQALKARTAGCRIIIEGFVEYGSYKHNYYAVGYPNFQEPPECADPPNSDAFGFCPQDYTFVGGVSPLANNPIWMPEGGPCGFCLPTGEDFLVTDCSCTAGGHWHPANGEEGTSGAVSCPDPITPECKDSSEYGIFQCNECGQPIGGGHLVASMGS